MAKFYAYAGDHELGSEPCGSTGRAMFELKTTRGAIRRCYRWFGDTPFRLYSYTEFYADFTFKLIHRAVMPKEIEKSIVCPLEPPEFSPPVLEDR